MPLLLRVWSNSAIVWHKWTLVLCGSTTCGISFCTFVLEYTNCSVFSYSSPHFHFHSAWGHFKYYLNFIVASFTLCGLMKPYVSRHWQVFSDNGSSTFILAREHGSVVTFFWCTFSVCFCGFMLETTCAVLMMLHGALCPWLDLSTAPHFGLNTRKEI